MACSQPGPRHRHEPGRRAPGQRLQRLLVLPLALLAAGCGSAPSATGEGVEPSLRPLVWERLPDPPLAPREGAVVVAVGGEVLVLGGDTSPVCPDGASCAGPEGWEDDGAALDLATATWRKLADAPRPPRGPATVVGDVVWVRGAERGDATLLSYDLSEDRWTGHPAPPGGAADQWVPVSTRGAVVALRLSAESGAARPDAVYDSARRAWTELPRDPLHPSFDRSAVDTPAGLLVTGAELVPQPGSEGPSLMRAELLDVDARRWEWLPDSDQLVTTGGAVHGGRVWFPALGGADGGEVDGWGRTVPYGGVLDLSGRAWSRLPHPPEPLTGGWPVGAAGGRYTAVEGWLLDVEGETWTRLPRPAGAPERPGQAAWAGDSLVVVGGQQGLERSPGAWLLRR